MESQDEQTSHADYPMSVAAESVNTALKQKRRKYSHHRCPRCHKERLERKHLPGPLRLFRLLPGLNPRRYVCDDCGKRVILWAPPRT